VKDFAESIWIVLKAAFKKWWFITTVVILGFVRLYQTLLKPELPKEYQFDITIYAIFAICGAFFVALFLGFHRVRMDLLAKITGSSGENIPEDIQMARLLLEELDRNEFLNGLRTGSPERKHLDTLIERSEVCGLNIPESLNNRLHELRQLTEDQQRLATISSTTASEHFKAHYLPVLRSLREDTEVFLSEHCAGEERDERPAILVVYEINLREETDLDKHVLLRNDSSHTAVNIRIRTLSYGDFTVEFDEVSEIQGGGQKKVEPLVRQGGAIHALQRRQLSRVLKQKVEDEGTLNPVDLPLRVFFKNTRGERFLASFSIEYNLPAQTIRTQFIDINCL